jgi:hypothetical protein
MMTKKPIADISKFEPAAKKQEEGAEVPILDPLGNPAGFSIWVAGPDSEVRRNALRTIRDERKAAGKFDEPDADETRLLNIRVAAMCTTKWDEFMSHGEVMEFSVENARKVYSAHAFIYDQVDAHSRIRGIYFLEDAPNSAAPPSGAGTNSET